MMTTTDDEVAFDELSPATKAFLKNLRTPEVELLEEAISIVRSVMLVGRITKWCMVLIVGGIVGVASFGEAIGKIKTWFVVAK